MCSLTMKESGFVAVLQLYRCGDDIGSSRYDTAAISAFYRRVPALKPQVTRLSSRLVLGETSKVVGLFAFSALIFSRYLTHTLSLSHLSV
jgi:hypothetical protein